MRLKIVALMLAAIAAQFGVGESAQAQELEKFKRDYSRPLFYHPSDPWFRGKVFNVHTKHYGKFYNCDGEEDKRNSPYIGWKEHTDCDFPPHKKFKDCLRDDLTKVLQRVKDGAGDCYQPPSLAIPQWAPLRGRCGCGSCRIKNCAGQCGGCNLQGHAVCESCQVGGPSGQTSVASVGNSTPPVDQLAGCDCATCRSKHASSQPTVRTSGLLNPKRFVK